MDYNKNKNAGGAEMLLEKSDFPGEFEIGKESVGVVGIFASATPYTLLTRVPTDNDKMVTGKRPLEEFAGGREKVLSIDRQAEKTVVRSRLTFKKIRISLHRYL